MFKRFQTYLLFIVSGLLLAMLFCDMCSAQDVSIKFTEKSQFLIFSFTTFALSVITICYSKKPLLQMRLCILNSLMLLGYQIWIIVYFFKLKEQFTFSIASLFPLISIILLVIAIRYILRDAAAIAFSEAIAKKKK